MNSHRRPAIGVMLGVAAIGLMACQPAVDGNKSKAGKMSAGTEALTCPSHRWGKASNGVEVNYDHIFCGELNSKGRVVGFHSRPRGNDPNTVANMRVTQKPNKQGIYAGQWELVGNKGGDKFSTFFPDHCTPTQVINTIGHAARNQQACPKSAPDWAWCGPSAPKKDDSEAYCRGADGTNYLIAGASSSRGGVNTAFPLR
ncbi:MAG: EndoU domain-containing protein [Thiotrichales bacterium]